MENALSNPLILQEIFQHIIASGFQEFRISRVELSSRVKDLRLVSKCWDQVLLSLAIPKLIFKLNPTSKRGHDGDIKHSIFNQFCANMTPKLARSIHIEHRGEDRSILGNMKHFLKTFSPIIQDIYIVGAASSTLLLVQILEMYVPNLRKLRIFLFQRWEEMVESKSQKNYPLQTQIPVKTRLKEIHLLRSGTLISDRILSASLMRQLQVIINASPNLAHLSVNDMKCPDLSKCPHLVSLSFTLSGVNPFEEALESLCLALSQVKHSLQGLELRSDKLEVQSNFLFKLPPMSKLKILRNKSPKRFPMGKGMIDIGAHRMNSLEILELTLTVEEMEKFLWKTLHSLYILRLKHVHIRGSSPGFPIQVEKFMHWLYIPPFPGSEMDPYIPGVSSYRQTLYSVKRLRSLVFLNCAPASLAMDYYLKTYSLPIHFNPEPNNNRISEATEQARRAVVNDPRV